MNHKLKYSTLLRRYLVKTIEKGANNCINKKCCLMGFIFFLVFINSTVSADTTIHDYIDNFNTITDDYATGAVSTEEFLCNLAKEQLYFDYQFFGARLNSTEASDLIRDLNEKYENKITMSELDAALSMAYEPLEDEMEGVEDAMPAPPVLESPQGFMVFTLVRIIKKLWGVGESNI